MAQSASSLAENIYVQEFFSILKENGKDTAGLTGLLTYVKQMEDNLKSAEAGMSDIKSILNEMKEVQNSPIKTAAKEASQFIQSKIAGVKAQLEKVRSAIIDGCKKAVQSVKDAGVTALDKLAGFFHVKQGLEAIRRDTAAGMAACDKCTGKIERASEEYHQTGLHLKNVFRVFAGKEPVAAPKEMGNAAKAVCASFDAGKECLNSICATANKAIAKLDEIGKSAAGVRNGREQPSFDERLADAEEKAAKINTAAAEKAGKVIELNLKTPDEAVTT